MARTHSIKVIRKLSGDTGSVDKLPGGDVSKRVVFDQACKPKCLLRRLELQGATDPREGEVGASQKDQLWSPHRQPVHAKSGGGECT